LSRPFSPRSYSPPASFTRVNGKIRAREVRVIDDGQKNLGVMPLGEAINLARAKGVDLVEIAAGATPPVCRLVDFGKYRYELPSRRRKRANISTPTRSRKSNSAPISTRTILPSNSSTPPISSAKT
jgi:translation initiation factor IF-3